MAYPSPSSWRSLLKTLKSLAQTEARNIQNGRRYFAKMSKGPRQVPREKPAVKPRVGGGYPLLIIPLTCVGLGTWQIRRREWKLNLIKDLETRMYTAPTDLPLDLEELKGMEYKRVKVKGTFDHEKELFIGPRSSVHEPETMGSQRAQNIGVHVVTPFKLSGREETILVNRGHVPFKKQPPQMRKNGQVEGEVELVGVVRLTDKKPLFGQDPHDKGYWVTRDVEEMAEVAETSTVFLDADHASTVPGGPEGGQTRVTLRNEHLTYIITWYSLAVLTFVLWYKNYRSVKPSRAVLEYMQKQGKNI